MNILFVASECGPFIKTGGLADVIGSFPKTLAGMGIRVRILLPAYPPLGQVMAAGEPVRAMDNLLGGAARVVAASSAGLELLLLDAPHLYERPGNIYVDAAGRDWSDNAFRFGALSKVAAEIAISGIDGWKPDVVHAHDWQAALIPAYLKAAPGAPPTILTIHNIAFQGLFDPSLIAPLGLPDWLFHPEGMEYYGHLGFLKAGIAFAQKVTTVSPTYAAEIMTPEFGMGLEGIVTARAADLTGILNGIELVAWNPVDDLLLPRNYSGETLKNKAANRAEVARRFALDDNQNAPLFCVISRMTTQKGLDVLLEVLPRIVARGARLAVLGAGDKGIEARFAQAARTWPGAVGCVIGYDEPLSHLMLGGSDAILVPSRFEPCGLTQLYGLRYGTLPVVTRTGGLADTVIDADPAAIAAGTATGFQFSPVTPSTLEGAIDRACTAFRDPQVWTSMVKAAMAYPVGWEQSAKAYKALYDAVSGAS
ncbi:MAG: glycogen synthase GlgA [Deltaproteobacteria bacterium]|nr:glycogen synthase GlgA [Deltaproteobacteria bacterium]